MVWWISTTIRSEESLALAVQSDVIGTISLTGHFNPWDLARKKYGLWSIFPRTKLVDAKCYGFRGLEGVKRGSTVDDEFIRCHRFSRRQGFPVV